MKHFTPETLAEFARRILPGTHHDAIRQHLLTCSACARQFELYRHIIFTGSRETSYAPPDGIVRSVKACFALQKPARARSKVELLFDSLAQPVTAGARAASAISAIQTQQLLYRIGNVYLDMALDHRTNSRRASLIGQMLDSSRPTNPPAGVPVVLLSGQRSLARTASNDYGEFQLEFAVEPDLKLSVAVNRENPVCLPLATTQTEAPRAPRHRKRKPTRSSKKSS